MTLFNLDDIPLASPHVKRCYVICLDENEQECFIYRDLHPVRSCDDLPRIKPRLWTSAHNAKRWIDSHKWMYPYLKYSNFTITQWDSKS